MKTSDFSYDLPNELIAQTPLKDRDASRMLVLGRKTGNIEHKAFSDILDYLRPNDCVILNDTRVIPARLYASKKGSGSKIEILLLKRIDEKTWEAIVRPGKKVREGDALIFSGEMTGEIIRILDDGNRIIEFHYNGIFEEILDRLGEMPLPPYIKEKLEDRERYQTVYAKFDGSAAAPTAGLHFTSKLLAEIANKGVKTASVTLHVGLGTFRPVKTDFILEHKMHSEYFILNKENADIINSCRKSGGRLIAVGTTTCRVLETVSSNEGLVYPKSGETDIFIYPSYKFKAVDCLITNFHLPESTLVMLVSALAGTENILAAYNEAVKEKYRFFSFGDSMFITDAF